MSAGFVLSKVLWGLLSPASLIFLALSGAWWWHRRRPRLSRALVAAPLLAFGALGALPLLHWAAAPLERRFPAPAPDKVDGIIVLGGALDLPNTVDLRQPALDGAAERMTQAVALSRRYPQAKLLFSGGSGLVRSHSFNESQVARALFESLGVDPAHTLYEDRSRNTWENALYSKKLADPQPGQTWLLVTSAWHMPRAVGCFRRVGWTVLPYPVDYLGNNAEWLQFDASTQLDLLTVVLHEWLGLLAYRALGHTDALFPAPLPAH
ncbi:MAG TPA: YdcF family protein [Nevskia sp.]|nr:YdcF family protein [Nevskia sp.]